MHFDRLPGKKRQQMAERFLGVGDGPIALARMPPVTKNGFDFRHALSGVWEEHNEPSRPTWLDLYLVCRRLHRSISLA
jgi:hypothetical protein